MTLSNSNSPLARREALRNRRRAAAPHDRDPFGRGAHPEAVCRGPYSRQHPPRQRTGGGLGRHCPRDRSRRHRHLHLSRPRPCPGAGRHPGRGDRRDLRTDVGCAGGLGGSMHLVEPAVGLLPTAAIIGAGLPIACGAAMAARARGKDRVAVAVFGDGSANIGAFHEALNFAAIQKLPVVFVCENNLYGEYTRIELSTPVEDIAVRPSSYNIPGVIVDGQDVDKVAEAMAAAVERARRGDGPSLIEMKTYRYSGHSRSDPATYRPAGELDAWLKRDPIDILAGRLVEESCWRRMGSTRSRQRSARVSKAPRPRCWPRRHRTSRRSLPMSEGTPEAPTPATRSGRASRRSPLSAARGLPDGRGHFGGDEHRRGLGLHRRAARRHDLGAARRRRDPLRPDRRRARHGRWPMAPNGASLFWAGMNKGKRSIRLDLRSRRRAGDHRRADHPAGPRSRLLPHQSAGQRRAVLRGIAAAAPRPGDGGAVGNADGSSEVDYTVNVAAGFPEITGPSGADEPVNSVLPAWDIAMGEIAAVGLLAADRRRSRTGKARWSSWRCRTSPSPPSAISGAWPRPSSATSREGRQLSVRRVRPGFCHRR